MSKIAAPLREHAVPVDSVQLDPSNARQHSERNLQAIADSLSKFGQRQVLVAREADRVLEAGNARLQAARDLLEWDEVAVIFLDDSELEATEYAIADNRTAELAAWNKEVLGELTAEFDDEEVVGFTETELDDVQTDWEIAPEDTEDIDDYDEDEDLMTLEVDGVHPDDKHRLEEVVNDALDEAGFEEYEARVY